MRPRFEKIQYRGFVIYQGYRLGSLQESEEEKNMKEEEKENMSDEEFDRLFDKMKYEQIPTWVIRKKNQPRTRLRYHEEIHSLDEAKKWIDLYHRRKEKIQHKKNVIINGSDKIKKLQKQIAHLRKQVRKLKGQ